MELCAFITFIVCFNSLILPNMSVWGYMIDLPACRSCSDRKDVPCVIQSMPVSCRHKAFGNSWPGKPRELKGKTYNMPVENKTTGALFNFTWKPPFDASIQSLDGFLISLNIYMDNIVYPPLCFRANLSGTDWLKVKDPHSVVFHFDCVKASAKTIVHFSLLSSPMPVTSPKEDDRLKTVFATTGYDPPTNHVVDALKVDYVVTGNHIFVEVGPLKPNVSYCACLILLPSMYEECHQKKPFDKGVNQTTFDDLEGGTYLILIGVDEVGKDSEWYETKPFNVTLETAVAAERTESSKVLVLPMMLSLLFVFVLTIIMYRIYKSRDQRDGGCMGGLCKNVFPCTNPYQQTQQSVPNNYLDEEKGTKDSECMVSDVLPLFIPESHEYTAAVSGVCNHIGSLNGCHVHHYNSSQPQFIEDKGSACVIVIFLSRELISVMKDEHILPPKDLPPMDVLQMKETLNKIKGKEFKKIIITFRTCTEELPFLKDTQIFDLSVGQDQNGVCRDFELNLIQILKTVTGTETLPSDWLRSEKILNLQELIKSVELSELVDSQSNGMVSYSCVNNCPFSVNSNYQQACSLCIQKYKQMANFTPNYQYTALPQTGYYHGQRESHDEQYVGECGFTSVDSAFYSATEVPYAPEGAAGDVPFEGPDSDTESDTFSMIMQKGYEINRNYMDTLNEEHHLHNG